MADYETRPLSAYHTSEWHASLNSHNNEAGPSTGRASRASTSSSSFSSRRRSSAANAPPAGPPPSQPIPSLPIVSEDIPSTGLHVRDDDYSLPDRRYEDDYVSPTSTRPHFNLNSFQRPSVSPSLAAVAAFSQARLASATSSPQLANLSDSPPRSLLPRSSQTFVPADVPLPSVPSSQEIVPDRLLLSPPEPKTSSSGQSRPSSRRALTRALELAREAVRLDSTNDDPHGAIKAYGESVTLLNEVMQRVMRGEDSGEHRHRNGRRRSIVAQEEEVRRLKSIHDTYADRMNILSLIYSIPVSQTTSATQSPRAESPYSDASRDTRSNSVTDNEAEALVPSDRSVDRSSIEENPVPSGLTANSPVATSTAPLTLSRRTSVEQMQSAAGFSSRMSTSRPATAGSGSGSRLRSSSNLPPRPPAPAVSPPSTPSIIEPPPNPPPSPRFSAFANDGSRSRGSSVSHKRTGSGNRLEALKEEAAGRPPSLQAQAHPRYSAEEENRRPPPPVQISSRHLNGESPPLPALPSPSSPSEFGSTNTPRGSVISSIENHDPMLQSTSRSQSPAYVTPRPRGVSALSVRSDSRTLINESPVLGTISQRRKEKSSTSSTIVEGVSSDTLMGPEGLSSNRLTGQTLPPNTVASLGIGRTRAASQPVRPSLTTVQNGGSFVNTNGQQVFIPGPRKTSSSFRQSPQPQAVPQTAFLTGFAPSSLQGLTLIPPPPVLPGHLPTTPTSPLPPLPPTDPLRKPYHLMSLLQHTMTSKSGGYITRKLHVPYEVWSQGGAKLNNLPEKVRVVEVLCEALAEIQNASVDFCGPMGVASGMGLGVNSVGKKEGDMWISKLEEFLIVCDNVVADFGKKLSVGEGFVVKKASGVTSWGGKVARQLDKLTNGKNLDSPLSYVQGLSRLFHLAQNLDEHTKALYSQPLAPAYTALSPEQRLSLELKLKRSSEFFASVVLTFVIRDLSQLLDKYAKKGEKWLAE